MGPYAYPITIHRKPQLIHFQETRDIDDGMIHLLDLAFVGSDAFSIETTRNGYQITVQRNRYETAEECERRVASEERYMVEYNARHK